MHSSVYQNNDINVLHRSHLFDRLAQGDTLVKYTLNGHNYDMGYYLADEIYPCQNNKCPDKFEGKTFCYCLRGLEKRC
jgi:hypothetical protein